MSRVQVTIEVDTDDVRDVLVWMRGEGIENHSNHAWLTAFVETEGEQRDAIIRAMPASLAWCALEFEKHGSDALDSVLRQASASSENGDTR